MVIKTRTGVWIDQPPAFDGREAEIIRGQCGLTQEEFARQLGVSERTYRDAERQGMRYHFTSVAARARLDFLMRQAKDAQERR